MISFYNTLTKQKEVFTPLNADHVTMYACGPTVYNYIHIGNGRAIVVFDTLYRLLKQLYPKVTYASNITDIDDKIIEAAAKAGVETNVITNTYTAHLIDDMKGMGCLIPDHQPKATEYLPQMITMIEALISKDHAYEAEGHVLFNVTSYDDYGRLSGRNRDEQIAGARVEVAPYKRDPADFVLWKPSTDEQPGWDSPWGRGRPGWHIECSAMSNALLGADFDIHGGGLDLIFPHHENEIAQSCCAHKESGFARYWIHNGFLNVNNEKMSKSLNNFVTVHELLEKYPGEVIRLALLSAQYRQPLEFTDNLLSDSKKTLDRWYRAVEMAEAEEANAAPSEEFMAALSDDLNTPRAITEMHRLANEINKADKADLQQLVACFKACAKLLGIITHSSGDWFKGGGDKDDTAEIETLIAARLAARADKNFTEADKIRNQLTAMGIILDDSANGTNWRRG